jgi:PleD family two-component response regulator
MFFTFSNCLLVGKPTLVAVSEKETENVEAIEKNALILLVDDDPDVLDASEMLLSMEPGFDIVRASSPAEPLWENG